MNREVHVLDLWGRAGEIPARYPAVHAPGGCRVTPRMRRRGADTAGLEDLPDGRRRALDSRPGQLPVDPAVAPLGILPGQPEDQGPDIRAGPAGRSCRAWTAPPGGAARCRGASARWCPGW